MTSAFNGKRMIPVLVALLMLTASAVHAEASKFAGDWKAILESNGMQRRITLHLSAGENGNLSGTLDSPDQGAMDIPLSDVALKGADFGFTITVVNGFYKGKFTADGTQLQGTWTTRAPVPLNFARVETKQQESEKVEKPVAETAQKPVAEAGAKTAAVTGKKPICGLLTMGDLGFLRGGAAANTFKEANVHSGVYAGVVILAQWKQLESERGKFDFSMIEDALANIRKYNAANPKKPLVGKLRVFAALGTPEWVKTLDGEPFTMTDKRGTTTMGHFWAKGYGDAWRELQAALAARYDSDPLMGEVAVSSCSSTTAEPFIIFLTPENMPALHKAGYSDAAMKSCLMRAIDDYAVWKNTPLDYTFNEFRNSDSGRPVVDPEFAPKVMEAFRAKYGSRGVIANHGLNVQLRPGAVRTYEVIKKLGPPIEFQTVAPNVDWNPTVAKGLTYRPTEIETWNSREAGGPADYTMADLEKWNAAMGCQAK